MKFVNIFSKSQMIQIKSNQDPYTFDKYPNSLCECSPGCIQGTAQLCQ